MSMTLSEKKKVEETIAASLRQKLSNYAGRKTGMPFHDRMLGKDVMQLFSFIQSLNTTFGTSIYGPVAKVLAKPRFDEVVLEKKLGGMISKQAQDVIREIMNDLESDKKPSCQQTEVEAIRQVCQKGQAIEINTRQVDVYLFGDGKYYLIDIKTAKPNIDGFEKYKENLLKWTATILYEDPQAQVGAMLAIPYNPNAPNDYKHWTMRGMIERGTQIKVAAEFWDFLAGKPVYDDLLGCFESVGSSMQEEIKEFIAQLSAKEAR